MGIISKLGVKGRILSRVAASLGTNVKRAVEINLPVSKESTSTHMSTSEWLPYQLSETDQTTSAESDRRLAQAIIEVQQSLRCL